MLAGEHIASVGTRNVEVGNGGVACDVHSPDVVDIARNMSIGTNHAIHATYVHIGRPILVGVGEVETVESAVEFEVEAVVVELQHASHRSLVYAHAHLDVAHAVLHEELVGVKLHVAQRPALLYLLVDILDVSAADGYVLDSYKPLIAVVGLDHGGEDILDKDKLNHVVEVEAIAILRDANNGILDVCRGDMQVSIEDVPHLHRDIDMLHCNKVCRVVRLVEYDVIYVTRATKQAQMEVIHGDCATNELLAILLDIPLCNRP